MNLWMISWVRLVILVFLEGGCGGSVRLEIHAVRGERKRVRMRTGVAESI
jgi:hypothetical protein